MSEQPDFKHNFLNIVTNNGCKKIIIVTIGNQISKFFANIRIYIK
jgi:hypothetical protein